MFFMHIDPAILFRMRALQNGASLSLFLALLFAHVLCYGLYLFPGSLLMWQLAVPVNRVFGPMLLTFDFSFGHGPAAAFAVLGMLAMVPILSYLRRYWLGTAISGHLALAVCGVLTWGALIRASHSSVSASLGPVLDGGSIDMQTFILATLTLLLTGFCAFNHFEFCRPQR